MVRATVSGAIVATIRPALAGWRFVAVISAGDRRTFVLAEQGADRRGTEFHEFRLSRSGQPSALTLLPVAVPAKHVITGMALSPDGGTLAIATQPGGGVQRITLYSLHGKVPRTWSASGGTIGAPFDTRSLSWPTSQRTLAFNWSVGQTASVRLLDLGTAGGSLLAASRPAVTLGNTARMGQTLYQCGNLVITPNGSAIVCPSGVITILPKGKDIIYRSGFPEFSVTTGRLIRIAGNWPVDQQFEPSVSDLLWSGGSGRVLIGVIHAAGHYWVGVVSGNTFTPLNVHWDPAAPDSGTW